jgi:diguanylate cyclase (GGDEF)-like protein
LLTFQEENSPGTLSAPAAPRTGLSAISPVWGLTGLLAVAALALFLGPVHDFPALAKPHLPWWFLAPAFLVAERCVVHLQFRRSAHSFSLGDVPLVLGLLFSTGADLIIGGVLGTAVTLMLERSIPRMKVLFNLAQFALAACLTTTVVHLLASPSDSIGPALWGAVFLATETSALITVLLIGVAIKLSHEVVNVKTITQMLSMDLVVTVTNTSLALAGALILATNPLAVPLLIVPAATVFFAYRAYLSQRERHEQLQFLYEATRMLSRAPEMVLALEGLLAKSLEAFRAELGEIVLFGSDGNPPMRTTLGPGDHKELMQPMEQGMAEELSSLVSGDKPAVRIARPFRTERLRRYLDGRLVTDAMIAMLPGEKRVIGTIMLANRFGVIRSFGEDDLKLFETLAGNASVALQYDRLEQVVLQLRELQGQLHHQAFHDPLTELANRNLFTNHVKDALSRDAEVAVLFIDADDFKTFNDSFGHAAGDALLLAIADRLRRSVRPSDVIARLGGDEFAVMVDKRERAHLGAITVAERIMKAFEQPVRAGNELVSVHLSIGIATTADSDSADELIRNADLAMYQAKERGKGRFELFHPRMREAVVKRHDLKEELRQAMERDQVTVEYQPIVVLATGEVVAAEALVRWDHPGRGRLPPSEFVPLAEETGLIIAVGNSVLEQACQQTRAWHEAAPDSEPLAIHVNLSAVELHDPGIADRVLSALKAAGIEPERLVLEITESLIRDADASAWSLRRLRDAGVRLALDDFGTGYSSLSYLRSLPLDILKIAKPFVEGIAHGRRESSFARMIVDLASTLGLQVIAEGIESAEELEALRDLGCELGQGFYLGAPLDARKETFPPPQPAAVG